MTQYDYNCCRDPCEILTDKLTAINNYVIYMLDRANKMFDISGLPDTMPERFVKMQLLRNGNCMVTNKYDGVNLYSYTGSLGEQPNEYYFPRAYIVNNPYQNFNATLIIGEDGVLIWNDSMIRGILPICERYAALLVESDISLRMAAINARAMNVLRCDDDTAAKSAQKFLNDLEAGKLGVAIGGNGNDWRAQIDTIPISANMGAGYITQLLELRQYFWASWWNELGVNSNYNMKRESINGNEAGMGENALLPLIDDMLENWQRGFGAVNAKYGTSIVVRKSSAWKNTEEEAEPEDNPEEEPGKEAETDDGKPVEDVETSE